MTTTLPRPFVGTPLDQAAFNDALRNAWFTQERGRVPAPKDGGPCPEHLARRARTHRPTDGKGPARAAAVVCGANPAGPRWPGPNTGRCRRTASCSRGWIYPECHVRTHHGVPPRGGRITLGPYGSSWEHSGKTDSPAENCPGPCPGDAPTTPWMSLSSVFAPASSWPLQSGKQCP
jgi:hypothetical protein